MLQLAAAFWALRLIQVTGKRTAWVLIATAISFMVVRRCFTLLHLLSGDLSWSLDLPIELVSLVTSILMVIGIARIVPLFLSVRRSEEALRQHATDLEARNEELDAFAHTVAHDLQNLVGLVIGYTETAEESYATMGREELRECLHAIARSEHRMSNIIDELLLLAEARKAEEVDVEPLDMAGIVARTQERLAHMVEKHEAKIILPTDWPTAQGHGPWVEEVLVNYLSNAIQYGGRPPRVELGATTQSDGMVRFWVRDNGAGLTPEEQARLFTPFTRLDQVGTKGHGLGLSIVRRIVEKLGGQVGVESEVGQGSIFFFTLPRVAGGTTRCDSMDGCPGSDTSGLNPACQ